MRYQSAYDSGTQGSNEEKSDDEDEGEGTNGVYEDATHEGLATYSSESDKGFVQEEDGFETQISSLN